MNILESFYAKRPDDPLYHYTDSTGLHAILSSKTLRATHIQFLNDSSEFYHAAEMILSRIKRAIDENDDARTALMLAGIKETVESITPNTYIVSFSENPDVLSQWRGYCPNGGYNIAFSHGAWEALLEQNRFVIVQCEYDEVRQRQLVDCLIESAIVEFRDFNPVPPVDYPSKGYADEFLPHLFSSQWFWNRAQKLATAIKNRAFEEEGEWRIIGGLRNKKVADDCRTKGSLLVPYQNFNIALNGSLNNVVTGITIGPTPNVALARFGIETFKYKCGATEVWDINSSVVPYRQL